LTVSGGLPVWASGITGNASTATALAANPTDCSAGQFATAIAANGNLTCAAVALADVSGAVGGASTLTTPGSIPFVTSAGVLGQSANLFWDNANGRLGVGTNAPNNPLQVVSTATSAHSIFVSAPATNSAGPGVGFASNNGANTGLLQLDNSGNLVLRQAQSSMFFDFASQLNFRANAGVTQLMRLLSNGNLLLGTTTDDGTNRLQVAGSARFATTANGTPAFVSLSATGTGSDAAVDTVGSGAYINLRSTLAGPYAGTQINKSTNTVLWFTGTQGLDSYGWFTGSSFMRLASLTTGGTLALYNEIPTIGSTSLVVRAGAGQGGNNLTTWQNSGGTEVARVNAGGGFAAQEFFNLTNTFYQNGVNVDVGSGGIYRFASIASQGGTKDLSLSRASANTLQVGDGSANSNGTILARIYTWANGTEGTCDATLRGQVVMVQGGAGVADTFRVCRKDAANAYAWTALY
jgi:hypothetical protein